MPDRNSPCIITCCLIVAFGSCLGTLPVTLAQPVTSSPLARPIIDPRTVSVRALDNGLRVIVRESHAVPVVALHVWVRAGSRYETSDTNGISHIIEHMVFRGSQNKKPDQVNDEIEGVGGYTNAETAKDSTRFYATVPSAQFDLALTGYADALLRPTFKQTTLDAEKRSIALELSRRGANPVVVLGDMVDGKAFKVHPYGLPPGGKPLSLAKISLSMVQDFHRKFYVAKNMTVVIVGDISAEAAFSKVAEAFGSARADSPPKVAVPVEPPQTEIRETSDAREVKQAALALAVHAPGMDKPNDVLAMDLLITILGEGKTSRLQKVLKGSTALVSEFQVDFLTQKDPGLFSITCVLPQQNIEPVRVALLKALDDLRQNPVGEKELEKAKALLEGQYAASNETFDGQASSLGFYEAIDAYQFALDYIGRIQTVTAETLQKVARTYLNTNAYTLGIIRPRPPRAIGSRQDKAVGSCG